jgi:hypothetical protein
MSRTKPSWSTGARASASTRDGGDDLINLPFVAPARGSPTDAVCKFAAEFQAPLADPLVYDREAASRQHLLDHRRLSGKLEIQPDRVADGPGGVAVTSKKSVSGCRHLGRRSNHPGFAKPDGTQLDGADTVIPVRGPHGAAENHVMTVCVVCVTRLPIGAPGV